MADLSRLDYLEGRVEEQSRNWDRLFADAGRVDQKIDALAMALAARIDTVNVRLDALDRKFDSRCDTLNQEIDALGKTLDSRIDGLRGDMATQFHWTIGIMTALVTGVLAAILTR